MSTTPNSPNGHQTTENQPGSSGFVPPRHWVGMEELQESYWNDTKAQEKRAQEFFEKPVEWVDFIDRTDKDGIARRDFLTIMGASMAMASFACARRPVHKIIPYVVKPEEITPGVATWYASTCKECATGCGVLIKNREGRPIKLEGNPDHPSNQGKLCARGQASVLNLYDPDRLAAPVTQSRADGAKKEISWPDLDRMIQEKLKALGSGSGRVRILTGETKSGTTRRLINEFLASFRSGEHVEYEALSFEDLVEGQNQAYGTSVVPHYHFDKAEVVLSLGADFLGAWIAPVEYAQAWAKGRKLDSAKASMSKLFCFEPNLTITGANADERYPIRPGDELKIALALANELIVVSGRSSFAGNAAVSAALGPYRPDSVAEEIGLKGGAEALKRMAQLLWQNRGKSLVVGGGTQSKTQDSVALQLAINLLNSALENEGATVDGTVGYSISKAGFGPMARLIKDMKAGHVDALIVYRSNPAFTLPKGSTGFEEALKQVPLVISVTDRMDETAKLSDFVLPDHNYLENWGDANPRKDLYSLQQPAMAPMHSTRAFEDSLLTWIKGGSLKARGIAARVPVWHDYLRAVWRETIYREYAIAASFEEFWETVLRKGVFDGSSAAGQKNGKSSSRSFRTASLAALPKPAAAEGGISLVLYDSIAMHDGRSANNAWLQELPDPISSITWDNYLNVSPVIAKKLALLENDVVEVRTGGVSVHLPVHVQPGMHSSVVSVAVGYGRRSVGKVGDQAGVDVFPLAKAFGDRIAYSGQIVELRKTGRVYKLANTQWHTVTENRPVINDITLAEFKKDPATANHTDPHLRLETVPTMWKKHEYKGYRWGMAIDLTSCIGCSACMIACQSENNVPVVGRDQVRVSRQMHWIRIDRYYAGSPENPDLVFQPMLCQHCENAPCETVCPVLATVHDDEGVNVQVYNRCVGTRYCQNNCPYKVRRFNYFDHWKSYEGTMNLAWNPDVTVRTRGIMEKCTFCLQRVRDAKDKAKDDGDKVRDGDVLAACQQTCPTDAIVFGDINDPESRVSKLRANARAFRALEVLNAQPAISYLSKVRNKEGTDHHGGGHHS